jgi:hypothetical protein
MPLSKGVSSEALRKCSFTDIRVAGGVFWRAAFARRDVCGIRLLKDYA